MGSVAVADPLTAPLPVSAPSSTPTWPCLACGARMAMAEDACHDCGRPFLPGDSMPALSLPGVGDVRKLDKMQRAFLTVGGVFAVMLALIALAFLAGSVL